jgi:hypothetical protein
MADNKETQKPEKLIVQTPAEKLHENTTQRPAKPQPQEKDK